MTPDEKDVLLLDEWIVFKSSLSCPWEVHEIGGFLQALISHRANGNKKKAEKILSCLQAYKTRLALGEDVKLNQVRAEFGLLR